MGYERYPRSSADRDSYGRGQTQDYGRDYGSGRDYSYSSAREYGAAGYGYDRDEQRGPYGQRGNYGAGYRGEDRFGDRYRAGSQSSDYHGSYAHDGRRFEDVGARRHWDDDDYRGGYPTGRDAVRGDRYRGQRGYGAQPQGYDYEDRGFLARAGDEVRSWFGDDEAERRREMDARYDDQYYANRGRAERDDDYHSWRSTQIAALDRDYDEYRHENRAKFNNEFSTWRQGRQTQRDSLTKVTEHMDVVGSDGEHVGTVDKVRGDRIILTRNDADAGGRHHSIPSRWIHAVDTKVTLAKTATQAKDEWRDEERNQAFFIDNRDENRGASAGNDTSTQGRNLNKSFSGTY